MFFDKKKKKKLSEWTVRDMARRGEIADRDDWSDQQKDFVDKVEKIAPSRHSLQKLLQVETHAHFIFLEDLELLVADEKNNPERVVEQQQIKDQQKADIERTRAEAAEAVEARRMEREQAEEAERKRLNAVEVERELDKKKEEEAYRQAARDKKENPLMDNPVERKQRSEDNLITVLEFLRHERYSNVAVLSLLLRITGSGARKTLNKMVRDGWLIRVKVEANKSSKKVCLYGISELGLGEIRQLWPDDLGNKKGTVFEKANADSHKNQHLLENQKARLFLQRYQNPLGRIDRRYLPERDMPGFGVKNDGWAAQGKFPDGVVENSHYSDEYFGIDQGATVAIEIERSSKGPKRYWYVIRKHLYNIEKRRYDRVVYFMANRRKAASMRVRFHEILDKNATQEDRDSGQLERNKDRFIFDTYEDLGERIKELG